MSLKKIIEEDCRRGDKQKACTNAGVTRTILERAAKRASIDECTDGEMRVIAELQKIKSERKNLLKTLQL